jgi:hypothetical protein
MTYLFVDGETSEKSLKDTASAPHLRSRNTGPKPIAKPTKPTSQKLKKRKTWQLDPNFIGIIMGF